MKIFKYDREDDYFHGVKKNDLIIKGIEDELKEIKKKNEYDIQEVLLSREMQIYKLTKPAININHLEVIKKIKNQISKIYTDLLSLELNIYINKSVDAVAQVTSNQSIIEDEKRELIIILSQHFLNDLEYKEQLSVIAHEVAHHYYDHTSVPFNEITDWEYDELTSDEELLDRQMFFQNLKKWSICKEISADLFALQVTKDYKATALALIKFETGIIKDANNIRIDLEDNFKSLQEDNKVKDILKEHPDTLLRIMILKSLEDYAKAKNPDNNKVQAIIDNQVEYIYPEILFDKMNTNIEYTYELGLLVSVADGKIDLSEIKFLTQMTYLRKDFTTIEKDCARINNIIKKQCTAPNDKEERKLFARKFIEKEIPKIHKKLKNKKIHVSSVIRNLLSLAKSDETIDADELETIYQFAKHEKYNYSKRDIIQQMFNLAK